MYLLKSSYYIVPATMVFFHKPLPVMCDCGPSVVEKNNPILASPIGV